MAFPGSIYAPPGAYTQTNFEDPLVGLGANLRIPVVIGTGNEILSQTSLTMVRGSSSTVDQRIVQEDETSRAVVSITEAGLVTLGEFNGALNRLQTRHYPIVTGDGTGTTATTSSSVSVTVDGEPVVLLGINGANGVLTLSTTPDASADVRVTYYFNRTDTLITDTLSDQVSPDTPVLYGGVGETYTTSTAADNDTFIVTVDDSDTAITVTFGDMAAVTAATVAAHINGASAVAGASLAATSQINNYGDTVVMLSADGNITIGAGTANALLGFSEGDTTGRNKVFYTFQRPIVDGSNGGVATTDPADVTVKVAGVQVIPTAVDGQTGAVTLAAAPDVGAAVTIQYYFNSWQDTFDYLAHRNVTDITLCGLTPDRDDYVDGVDFVLQDDLIVWGTAVLVTVGEHTTGAEFLDSTQVRGTLIDVRHYLAPCTAIVNTDNKGFTLPLQPTTGNGRNSPLGSATFLEVANGRVDLPTDRPDLVYAYWGFSVQDAIERGRVDVAKVEGEDRLITLENEVPVGATVYATFYYNTLVDEKYSIVCASAGGSGVGTYSVADEDGDAVLIPTLVGKSAALSTITVEFPSGSEGLPGVRLESPFDTDSYVGPVAEVVTAEFAAQDATLAKYTVPGSGPYDIVSGSSDNFDLEVDGSGLAGGFVNLSDPTGANCGFAASLVGGEVEYTAASTKQTYVIDSTNRSIDLQIDGVDISASAVSSATATLAAYVTAINGAAAGEFAADPGGSTTTAIVLAATASDIDDYYVGWNIRFGAGLADGEEREITAYDGGTQTATVAAFAGAPVVTDTYHLYNPDTLPKMAGATPFNSAVIITAGEYDDISFQYNGSTVATTPVTCTLTPGTYASGGDLADEVETQINAALAAMGSADAVKSPRVVVDAANAGRLSVSLLPDIQDTTGAYIEFLTDATPAEDFCILAGFDTDTASGGQAKLVTGPIARRFTFTGAAPAGNLVYDRLILRNRILPGNGGSLDPQAVLDQCYIKAVGGTGASDAGLTAGTYGWAGSQGTMTAPTMLGCAGWEDGQVAAATYGDARDGQQVVTFFQSGGTTPQNNELAFTIDGISPDMEFTDAAGATINPGLSADVPLGPAGTANTVINQIAAAIAASSQNVYASAAAVLAAGLISQEGDGIRLRGLSVRSTASMVMEDKNATTRLGFSADATTYRTQLQPEVLASGLMAHAQAAVSAAILNWSAGGAATYLTSVALASMVKDGTGAEYLFLQSLGAAGAGTLSSVFFDDAATDSVTLPTTGLGVVSGDGNAGEAAVEGYFVISTSASGSGTANTSLLNSGVGQDGQVGQTYQDAVTGLTFTILPRAGGAPYPAGSTVTFQVAATTTCDANIPTNTIPGLWLYVANTKDVDVGDSGIVATYERGGAEPGVGDVYYVSYDYTKQDYGTQLYSKMAAVEAAYGEISPLNPVSLGGYLALINGAVLLGVKQVKKDADADSDGVLDSATQAAYIAAIDELAGAISPGVYPDMLVPLKGDDLVLFEYLAQQCDIQSSIRYRAERTAICGVAAGTQPSAVGDTAQAISRTRFRLVYPDLATLTLARADGSSDAYLVDGTYIAAALAGNRSSPTIDVATPWTGARLFGFDKLGRTLDAVEQNQVAVNGVTILEDKPPLLRVRQGLATDMTSVLTKTPTVITIADEVQRQARFALERFIGQKFLVGVTSQIELQLTATMKALLSSAIIAAFTGITAQVAEDDPTVAEVEAFYQPVFPLLYIVVTFNLRSNL